MVFVISPRKFRRFFDKDLSVANASGAMFRKHVLVGSPLLEARLLVRRRFCGAVSLDEGLGFALNHEAL